MDPKLASALALVEADIDAAGIRRWLPPVDGPHFGYIENNFAAGLLEGDYRPDLAYYLASELQDWIIERLWAGRHPTNWPPCPRHPATHPLRPVERDQQCVWVCPSDDGLIAPIGSLGSV